MTVARKTQIVASSAKGWEEAVREGLKRANETLRNITGIEVVALKAKVEDGQLTEFRADMNITFILE